VLLIGSASNERWDPDPDLYPHQSDKLDPDPHKSDELDPDPQSDKLDPDPHQFSDDKQKSMEYEPICHFVKVLLEPLFGS
jgi:hypothetical protein